MQLDYNHMEYLIFLFRKMIIVLFPVVLDACVTKAAHAHTLTTNSIKRAGRDIFILSFSLLLCIFIFIFIFGAHLYVLYSTLVVWCFIMIIYVFACVFMRMRSCLVSFALSAGC